MKIIRFEEKTISTQTVLDWWRHKLEKRETVPKPPISPIISTMVRWKNFGWNQILSFDYLELSYESYCQKNELECLPTEEFHAVFVHLFTDRYRPKVSKINWYGFMKYIDPDEEESKISKDDYMVVSCYRIPNVFFCRALYEMAIESDPIEWLDGTRMEESYKNSRAFWNEISKDIIEEDKFIRYGENAFLPKYIKRVHRSKL